MQTVNINVNVFFMLCLCLHVVAEEICDHVICFGNPGIKRSSVCTCDCQNTGVQNLIKKSVACTISDDQDLGLLFDSLPLTQRIQLTCGSSSVIQRQLNESIMSKHNSTLVSFRSCGCKFDQINQHTFKNFKNLSEVAIVNGNITHESIPAFLSIPTLVTLNLDSNHFPRLDSYTFCKQNVTCALQTLSLRSNSLHNLSESTFRGLSGLLKIDLSGNNLETVPIDHWSDLNSLTNINLTWNRIQYLPNNTALQNIETFDVSVNKLTRYNLKMGRGTWNFLQYLNVSHNEISIIKTKDFVLYGVKVLDLSFNKIEFIEKDAFDDVAGIEIIDLRYNRLKRIPDDYHNQIEYLYFYTTNVFGVYFYGNPLECGCKRIEHLKRGNGLQTDHLRVLDYNQLMCVEPYSAAGQLVSEVSLQN
ncbi:chaoptin-like, partial [Anneissia japonica]|uniref:chaoptin-like n=1 Tax=Anneissia japonica TaxID=1529436 RepID=UPI0014257F29